MSRVRKLKRMSVEADQMRESDRLFFERFPWRQHRLRKLARAEIAQLEDAFDGEVVMARPDDALFVIVKNLAAGVRLRIHLPGPADQTGDDAPEGFIAALWKARAARSPDLVERELQIQKAMRLPGGPLHKGGAA